MKLISRQTKFRVFFSILLGGPLFFSSCSSGDTQKDSGTDTLSSVSVHQIKWAGSENGGVYFVDENEQPLFNKALFYNAHDFHEGYCVVTKMVNGVELYGLIDSTGKEVIPCTNDAFLDDVDGGMVKYSKDGKYGYMNLDAKLVIPCEYTGTKGFSANMVKLQKEYKKWGILNSEGKLILPFEYDEIGLWADGLAPVKRNGKWGFVNTSGELAIPLSYDFAREFEQGICLVGRGDKLGLINTKNEPVTDFIFDNYKTIVDVRKNDFAKEGISESNERLIMEEGLIVVSKNKLWGLLNPKGEMVLPCEYSDVGLPDGSGKLDVEKEDKHGKFDLETKTVQWY